MPLTTHNFQIFNMIYCHCHTCKLTLNLLRTKLIYDLLCRSLSLPQLKYFVIRLTVSIIDKNLSKYSRTAMNYSVLILVLFCSSERDWRSFNIYYDIYENNAFRVFLFSSRCDLNVIFFHPLDSISICKLYLLLLFTLLKNMLLPVPQTFCYDKKPFFSQFTLK